VTSLPKGNNERPGSSIPSYADFSTERKLNSFEAKIVEKGPKNMAQYIFNVPKEDSIFSEAHPI
jgi:hypothetical protein